MGQLNFRLPAPAKLNLFLHILGRRADGYHELQTVFQLLDYCDWLTFEPAQRLLVECPGIELPPAENLVYRAAQALQEATGHREGAHIRVTKNIPAGGGLGGGSSDAATTLAGLNLMWRLGLDTARLAEIGRALGADVPVFVAGRSAWAEGIGEKLQPVDLPDKVYLVISPGCEVATAEIFAHPDLTRQGTAITIARFLEGGTQNVCEPVVRRLYPPVDEALQWLGQWGTARMTGTGSCVYVAFATRDEAQQALAAVPDKWQAFVAEGVNVSPLLGALSQAGMSLD